MVRGEKGKAQGGCEAEAESCEGRPESRIKASNARCAWIR